jgi:predicted transcriptional regulator
MDVQSLIGALRGGNYMPVHKPGTQPQDYLNELLQNPDIMQQNINQASNFAFGAMARPLYAKPPASVLRQLIKSGSTLADIGKQYGVSAPAVSGWLKSYQINANPSGRTPLDLGEIVRRLDRGETHQQIADALGASRGAVSNKVFSEGLTNLTPDEWKEVASRYKQPAASPVTPAPSDPLAQNMTDYLNGLKGNQ